ncbi:MAG: HTH domain-containing protein [Pirellulaceae bacterium]
MPEEGSQRQRFYLHQRPALRPYICVVNQDRWPFDFSDNQFKPVNELASLHDAILYADGRPEERAAYGCSYSAEFDLSRLVAGSNTERVPQKGAIVSVHWLLQQGEEPDAAVDKRAGNCRLRLTEEGFVPLDRSSAEQLDESVVFEKRAQFVREYEEFTLKEIAGFDVQHRRVAEAVSAGSVADALRVLADDLCFWAGNLKPHFYHHISHSVTDPSFVRMRDVPEGASFQVLEHWIIRDWIGSREVYDLLEFHKSPEYAQSFSNRLETLHQARVEFANLLTQHTVQSGGDDIDGDFALDEVRKDLKHRALWLADHLRRIAIQFEASSPASRSAPTSPGLAPTEVATVPEQEPSEFSGGTMAFHADRVELCGVDICSGPRSSTRRKLLDLLRQKRSDGSFIAYSGDKLAAEAGLTGGAPGAVRDLREAIRAALRDGANIICGKDDVVLSGGPGYRLSESVAIELSPEIADITDTGDVRDDYDPSDSDVLDVPDDPALVRQAWIVEQLENGVQLKGPDIAHNFACSAKTAQRDLAALKKSGEIEFVGPARSGYYRLKGESP